MKLVFVHDHIFTKCNNCYYSTGGLTSDALKRYTNVFEDVVIVARCKKVKKITNNLSDATLQRVSFSTVPNFKKLTKVYLIFRAMQILTYEIKRTDYLIARASTLGNIAVFIAKKYNKPYLFEVAGCAKDALWNLGLKGKFFAPFEYLMQKKCAWDAPYVVYVTKYFLQQRYPTKGKSIDCSNVLLEKSDNKQLYQRLQQLKVEHKKVVIGTIGSIDVKYKGQERVLRALRLLELQGRNYYEYQMVGAGNMKRLNNIRKKLHLQSEIKFIGTLEHKHINAWLDNIDIYIQPSTTEGLPRALIEAMSRGIYSIGSNAGGIPELLDSETIFKLSKNCEKELAEKIKEFDNTIFAEKQITRNFIVSQNYVEDVIENRRDLFLREFKNDFFNIETSKGKLCP